MKFDIAESVKNLLGVMESIQNVSKSEIGISTFGQLLIKSFDLTSLIKNGQSI
ncbi:TPA: hypothetical protein ACGN81_005501 [Bacillus cereus]